MKLWIGMAVAALAAVFAASGAFAGSGGGDAIAAAPEADAKPTLHVAKLRAVPGSYAGNSNYLKFLVPAGARNVVDISVLRAGLTVNCAGGGSYYNAPFTVPATKIKRDRTFTAKGSQSGVLEGVSARWTYSVTGRFQGTDSSGRATAAGVFRQDVVFTDTPNRKCTSNNQPWTAARSQPPSKSAVPGTYAGNSNYLKFLVPAGARNVVDISVLRAGLTVNCAGGGSYYNAPFTVPATKIKRDRTFTAKGSQSGVLEGVSARWTYSVTGRFQGTDSSGRATAAGVFRQDVVFTDTPNRKCTSNDQHWTAIRTG